MEEIYGPWTTASTIIDKEEAKQALSWEETKKNLIITDEQEEVDALLNSPSVQKEFCDYMIHSSKTIISRLKSMYNKYFRILRKAPWKTPWTSTW